MDSENNVKKHENDNRTAHGHEKKQKKHKCCDFRL